LADLVRSCEHEVVDVVNSGLDAIRAYQRHKPDVVLMDVLMSRLNGLTACRNILCGDPAGRIVFLSGASSATQLAPQQSGAIAVLQKPIAISELKTLLDGLSAPSPRGS
jgi:CheY-like chemotaxis protein